MLCYFLLYNTVCQPYIYMYPLPLEPLSSHQYLKKKLKMGFSGGSDSKESACNEGDMGVIPGSGRSPKERNSHPLQYSCLENSMDREAWSQTQLSE